MMVPLPGAVSTAIAPLCARMMPSTAERPRPRPVNFVVKKGSKILAFTSSDMPQPVSLTSRTTKVPPGTASSPNVEGTGMAGVPREVTTVTIPCLSPQASAALITRFIIT